MISRTGELILCFFCVCILSLCSTIGCFWTGVFSTQVGYTGGFAANPTYHEVCTGITLCPFLCIYNCYTIVLPSDEEVNWVGRTFLCKMSQGSREKRKQNIGRNGVLSTALSSSQHLPFICSHLLRMHRSRWAVPPIPTLPWPTCKDWALYCAVLQRFYQQRLLCMKRHKWASFPETMIWQTWY